MKTYLWMLLCVLSTKTFAQQPGNINGKIVDGKTNQPIEYEGLSYQIKAIRPKK
jgi:hypothetical protein